MDKNEVAVEFADFADEDSRHYCAFIYKNGDTSPTFIPLCSEKELTALFGNRINYAKEAVARQFSPENLSALYDLVWKPMENLFAPDKEIYFSPSGLLNRLPLEYAGGETAACDKCRSLRRITATKDIPYAKSLDRFDRIVLYGDMNYYENASTRNSVNAFGPLTGSRREVAAIKSSLGTKIPVTERSRKSATESGFKALSLPHDGKALLHLSTHGFYFPEDVARSQYYYTRYSEKDMKDYPLLRSAIVMSGANLVWTGMKETDGRSEDGILTAQEISGLDL